MSLLVFNNSEELNNKLLQVHFLESKTAGIFFLIPAVKHKRCRILKRIPHLLLLRLAHSGKRHPKVSILQKGLNLLFHFCQILGRLKAGYNFSFLIDEEFCKVPFDVRLLLVVGISF